MIGCVFSSCVLLIVLLSCLSAVAGESIAPATRPTQELKVGDMVVIIRDGTLLKIGTSVIAELKKGTSLRVTGINGNWVGGTVEIDGKKATGWLKMIDVEIAAPGAKPDAGMPQDVVGEWHGKSADGQSADMYLTFAKDGTATLKNPKMSQSFQLRYAIGPTMIVLKDPSGAETLSLDILERKPDMMVLGVQGARVAFRRVGTPELATTQPAGEAKGPPDAWRTDYDQFSKYLAEATEKSYPQQPFNEFNDLFAGKQIRWKLEFKGSQRDKDELKLQFRVLPSLVFVSSADAAPKWSKLERGSVVIVEAKITMASVFVLNPDDRGRGAKVPMVIFGDVKPAENSRK